MTFILTHTGVPIKKDNIKNTSFTQKSKKKIIYTKKNIYTKNILNEIMDPL